MLKDTLILSFFFLLSMSISCKENATNSEDIFFKAVVLGAGIDCGDVYLVEFDSNEMDNVTKITNSSWGIYYADNLPAEFKQDSLEIFLKLRMPENDEIYPCTTFGPGYPHIVVVEAIL